MFLYSGNFAEFNIHAILADKFLQTLGYLAITCNLSSCVIMGLVLRHLKNMVKSVSYGREVVKSKLLISKTVTTSHICLILGFTITSILCFNVSPNSSSEIYRNLTAWNFFGGVSDLFLTCMLWFILDNKS